MDEMGEFGCICMYFVYVCVVCAISLIFSHAHAHYLPRTMGVDKMAGTVNPTPTLHISHQVKEVVKDVAIPKKHSIAR